MGAMSTALGEAAGIVPACVPVFEPPDVGCEQSASPRAAAAMIRKVDGAAAEELPAPRREEEEVVEDAMSSGSSIGRNSDSESRSADCDREEDAGEAELQSALKGPLDANDALEEALPMRRGISKFYCGKSKSYTNLADISSSSSARDLAKPGNAYTRKRKNLLAFSINWDRRSCSVPSNAAGSSTPKRPANSSRDTAGAPDGGGPAEEQDPPRLRPPLHPNKGKNSPPQRCHFSVWSFSLADL